MSVQSLFAEGRLQAAIEALGQELRANPTDSGRRSFLFELTSFAGDWERASRQLDVLARESPAAEAGTLVYRAAILAERVREHMFDTGDFPSGEVPAAVSGTLNGQAFSSIRDADPRIGARLEIMAGGRYLWIPFAHLAAVTMQAPARLRDLRWASAQVAVGPGIRDQELGEVLLPALTPAAWRHPEDDVRLGRSTDWTELPSGDFAPVGSKLLMVDDRYVPLLDIRELRLNGG